MKARLTFTLLTCLLPWSAFAQSGPSDLVTIQINVNNQLRRFVIQLNEDAAPQTVANFRRMVDSGYYKGLAVHRAIPNYLVQMGDPLTRDAANKASWGTGGPDHTVPAELSLPHTRGAVAMARLPDSQNPNRLSNGSQFYVALDDLPNLDGKYTVFGQVVRGIEHLDYISETTVDTNDVPLHRMEIASANMGTEVSGRGLDLDLDLKGAGEGAKAAGGAMKDAGGKVASVIPFVGKDKDSNVPPSYADSGEPAQLVSTADGVPPEFDLLEDEIASSTTAYVDGPEDLENFDEGPYTDLGEDMSAMEELRNPLPQTAAANPTDFADAQPMEEPKKRKLLPTGKKNEDDFASAPPKEKKGIGGLMPSFGKKDEEVAYESQNLEDLPILSPEEEEKGGIMSMVPTPFGNKNESKVPGEEKDGFSLPFVGGNKNGPSDEDLQRDDKEKKGLFGGKDKKEEELPKEKGKMTKLIERVW